MKKLPPISLPQNFPNEYSKRLNAELYKILGALIQQVNELIDEVTVTEYAPRYDYIDATTSYLGEALPGTLESAATWRIRLITTSGSDVTVKWADGNSRFDNVWDDRASLSYS